MAPFSKTIIWDFDDTLFCSHAVKTLMEEVSVRDVRKMEYPDEFLAKVEVLDQQVEQLLRFSMRNANLYIVSNGSYGWIIHIFRKLLPLSCEHLRNFTVVSTIDCGYATSKNPKEWKFKIFEDLASEAVERGREGRGGGAHIISFGDSPGDRNAALHVKKTYANRDDVYVKHIAFNYMPSLDDLIFQQKFILYHFNFFLTTPKHLDTRLDIQSNHPFPPEGHRTRGLLEDQEKEEYGGSLRLSPSQSSLHSLPHSPPRSFLPSQSYNLPPAPYLPDPLSPIVVRS